MKIVNVVLETDRLYLKVSDIDFVEKVLDFHRRNKEFLSKFEPIKEDGYYTFNYHKKLIQDEIIKTSSDSMRKFYIFKKNNNDKIIGSIALSNIVRGGFQSCFLGYKIDQEELNRGYMTEAINGVIKHAFNEMMLHRIEANIMPRNKASLRVVGKLGFIDEGISRKYLRINGVWEDHIHMVILNKKLE
ncbi:GNAT family N-acetyltransferase [Clostridium sp. D2Q-11]|uniref:GNAT family N-acetyltransferase n=1 Tax=Anaeromonas frigoriresistens TaxID=2683708 RepID=A0A942Z8W1_9FIRM|nr:GNAT family N-acetyltransferase [Anaeromonas frigoriresistens]MBS4538688.1 GNAT family N-acetyltransferase [Anaeromonas frigoriresistens]